MSWWDSSKGFSSFASQALKTAQQKIDKVLDIKEGEAGGASSAPTPVTSSANTGASDVQQQVEPQDSISSGGGGGEEFWNNWLGADTMGLGNSPLFSSNTKNVSKKSERESNVTSTIKTSKLQLQKQTTSSSSLDDKAPVLEISNQSTVSLSATETNLISATSDNNKKSPVIAETLNKDKNILLPKPSPSQDKSDNILPKKRAPLKLGIKSKSKDKDDSNNEEKQKSSAVEEMLQREKEAELKLLEMLSNESETKQQSNIKVSIQTKKQSSNMVQIVSEAEEQSGNAVTSMEKPANLKEDCVVVESLQGSGSTKEITQEKINDQAENNETNPKSECVEKHDEGKELSSRLDVQITASTISMDASQCDWGDAGLLTDSQLDTFGNTVEVLPDDKVKQIAEKETRETIEDLSEVDCVQDVAHMVDDNNTETNVLDEHIVDKTEENVIQENTTCENIDTIDPPESEIKQDNIITDIGSESEIGQSTSSLVDGRTFLPNVQSSSSTVSALDESLSSDNIDELSSSNQTLTADDFQSSVNSNKSSDKDNEEVIDRNEGGDQVEVKESEDLPSVHSTSETSVEHQSVQPKERSATMDSNQSTGSSNKSEHMLQSPQSMTTSHSSQCSSSSYVKNMLEEAMVESVKDLDSRSDSQSHSSSDMVRIESDQNSGHTSGDDLETATSSDIEIISHISTPTPNGDNRGFGIGVDRPFDLSPLRHALNKAVRRNSPPGHKRTDSGSSAYSLHSKSGDEVTSPSPMDLSHRDEHHKQHHEPSNDPYEKEKLLKEECSTQLQQQLPQLQPICESTEVIDQIHDANKYIEKLAEMAEVLEAREKKLVDLSRHNMDLMESNNILKNQLQQSEEAREAEMTDLNQLTDEFTKRISDAEKRFNQAAKEKEQLKKSLQDTEIALARRSDSSCTAEKLILEKDTQISELMAEGEKLSKQQLQSNNVIKKLRSKEKENENLLKSQREKIEGQKGEVERLQKILDNKCDVEKKQIESINQLQNLVKRQEKELEKYKSEHEDAVEKMRSMEVALDSSYKEIAELHKANVTKATERQEAALSQELQAKQELQIQLDRYHITGKQEQEALMYQIEDLRLSMSRMEKEHGRREDVLRQEISDLQQRLQEGEDRNQELTSSVTAATRPLLRQIENLQSTYTAQSSSYEKVEKNLTDRLSESQMALAIAQEKERVATEELMDLQVKVSSTESQLSSLRQDKSRLQAQLEMEKTKNEVLEDAKNKEFAQREALQHSLESRVSELKKEKLLIENQLEMEKMRVEAEKKKVLLAHEQIRDKELQLSQVKSASRSSTPNDSLMMKDIVDNPMLTSMGTSMSQSFLSQSDDLEKSFVFTPSRSFSNNHNSPNLYESLRNNGAASVMENLQSQLKQKDGEIVQLQSEIHELEKTRESMARELVNLTNENEELKDTASELPEARSQYKELDQRYNAILQMYGEKEEEVQELRLDLQDVKDLYKNQIDELLRKS